MSLRVIIKKWYIVLVCAVLCAGGLYYEKTRVVPVMPQTGDITYIRIVKFNQVPTETLKETNVEIKMDTLLKSWSNLVLLTKRMDNNIDMKKLNMKWDEMEYSQKFNWMTQHFRANWIGPGMYELIFQIKKNEVKDAAYIKESHEKIIGGYEDYFQETASMVTDDTNLMLVKDVELVEDTGMPTVQQVEKKYAVIGFVLGSLIGVIIVMVWDARKRIAQQ